MGMTEQQKEIALRVCREFDPSVDEKVVGGILEFASSFLAALPKPEPVGNFIPDSIERPVIWNQVKRGQGLPLYREPPIAKPATEQTNTGHEDTERLNYLIKSGRTLIESKGWFFTYNHTSGRSGPAMATPRAAIDASMDKKGGE